MVEREKWKERMPMKTYEKDVCYRTKSGHRARLICDDRAGNTPLVWLMQDTGRAEEMCFSTDVRGVCPHRGSLSITDVWLPIPLPRVRLLWTTGQGVSSLSEEGPTAADALLFGLGEGGARPTTKAVPFPEARRLVRVTVEHVAWNGEPDFDRTF